jgi:hypothetical protein
MMEKFWSDHFDMDLLKLFPTLPQILGATGNRALWTVGHETHCRLNHPTVWNTHGAYVWTAKPNLKRDAHGWFSVMGCVGDGAEIECTWMELLRDQWPHGYGFILMPMQSVFEPPPQRQFERIMYHSRGWQKDERIEEAREAAMAWLRHANHRFEDEHKRPSRKAG